MLFEIGSFRNQTTCVTQWQRVKLWWPDRV